MQTYTKPFSQLFSKLRDVDYKGMSQLHPIDG